MNAEEESKVEIGDEEDIYDEGAIRLEDEFSEEEFVAALQAEGREEEYEEFDIESDSEGSSFVYQPRMPTQPCLQSNKEDQLDQKWSSNFISDIIRNYTEGTKWFEEDRLMRSLNNDTNIDCAYIDGITLIMVISAYDEIAAMEKMKEIADPSKVDDMGRNALHYAAMHGSANTAEYILNKDGFDGIGLRLHEVKDKAGKTPMDLANDHGYEGAVLQDLIEDALPLDARKPFKVRQLVQKLSSEYVELSLRFEAELIKHKLALAYFDFRSFYFVFLPVTLIATLITIFGFLVSGTLSNGDDEAQAAGSSAALRSLLNIKGDEAINDGGIMIDSLLEGNSKQILSLVVGILGAISALINSIGKRTNYQSQADMHKSAVKALEKILMTVEFERDWFERNSRDTNSEEKGQGELTTKLGADLKTHQASFKAMLDACCDSPVPNEVEQAFTVLEQVFTQQKFSDSSDGYIEDAAPLKFYYHKLWKEHSKYWLWPLKAPPITVSAKYKKWNNEWKGEREEEL